MRPEPFVAAAAVCLLGGASLVIVFPNPVEASLWGAIAAVLAGLFGGVGVGLAGPDVPDRDYTAVGSLLVVAAVLVLVALAGRPAGGYAVALLGGVGAALVGFDSGLKRAGE